MSNNKRIAKNTLFLSIRTIFTMIITLYSSRVILQNLGIEDFGIYNVVGSVIIFWTAIRGVFASSTQRFLNVAMAEDNSNNSKKVFETSLYINIILSVVFLIFIGVIGFFFINNVLELPSTRIVAANWVFVFSLLSAVIGLATIPFDASVIANERMDFSALITIINATAKLIIAILIPYFSIDGLFFYGLGLFILAIVVRIIMLKFTKKHFSETSFRPKANKDILRSLLSFSGWSFLGNISYHTVTEGLNFLLNIFFGPTLNAARGIAYQVRTATSELSNTVLTATQPQTCKLMAKGEDKKVVKLFSLTSRSIYYLCLLMTVPILVSTKEILTIWLGLVPDFSVEFVRVILIYNLIRSLHGPYNALFVASGDIKVYQFIEIIILPLTLVASYIFLKMGSYPPIVFGIMAIIELLNLIAITIWANIKMGFSIKKYLRRDIAPIVIVTILSSAIVYLIMNSPLANASWVLRSITSVIPLGIILPLLGFTKEELSTALNSRNKKHLFS